MNDNPATVEQPSPTGNGADITERVIQDFVDRRKIGIERYGKPLRALNGRNAIVDAYQEAMDLTMYLRQKVEENGQKSNVTCVDIQTTSEIKVKLVQSCGGDHMVVAAAKVSTCGEEAIGFADPSHNDANAGLINYLMQHRHGSAFEHSSLTFFVHAPIFVWREWHRHRIGFSYNEVSARYTQLDPVFWIPDAERKIIPAPEHKSARPKFQRGNDGQYHFLCDMLKDSYRQSYICYKQLLDVGYAKEVARACLPVAIYSSCWVTCNPRSLMAFLSLRTHEADAKFVSYPQAEIETAARAAEKLFAEGWPLTHAAFVKNGRVGP